ncbi:MAG: hypothetical protein JNL80_04990 [Phycisphaerae bacterium]|nr:hypothetical protein [Phycisphaerae bacterium]
MPYDYDRRQDRSNDSRSRRAQSRPRDEQGHFVAERDADERFPMSRYGSNQYQPEDRYESDRGSRSGHQNDRRGSTGRSRYEEGNSEWGQQRTPPRDEYGQFTSRSSSRSGSDSDDGYDSNRTSRQQNSYGNGDENRYDSRFENGRDRPEAYRDRSWQDRSESDARSGSSSRDEDWDDNGSRRLRQGSISSRYDDSDEGTTRSGSRFQGYGQSLYRPYDDDRPSSGYRGNSQGRSNNLSYEDRSRGGRSSSASQDRDEYGRFTGLEGFDEEGDRFRSGARQRANHDDEGDDRNDRRRNNQNSR